MTVDIHEPEAHTQDMTTMNAPTLPPITTPAAVLAEFDRYARYEGVHRIEEIATEADPMGAWYDLCETWRQMCAPDVHGDYQDMIPGPVWAELTTLWDRYVSRLADEIDHGTNRGMAP